MSSFLLTFFFQTSILKVVVVNIGRRGKQMKELALYNLKEGMVLAKDITTPSGQVVLEKEKNLRSSRSCAFPFIISSRPALWTGKKSGRLPSPIRRKSRLRRSFSLSRWITRSCSVRSVSALRGYVNEGKPLDTSALLSKVVELFQSCKTSLELFNMLHNMHSLRRQRLCTFPECLADLPADRKMDQGRRRHFRHADARRTASRHRQAQDSNRASQQTGQIHRRRVRAGRAAHPVRLRTVKAASAGCTSKLAALSHHERCDGTGYPNGLTTNDIDPYARVVAIADVYDAMTTARSYRAPCALFRLSPTLSVTVCRNTIPNVFSHSSTGSPAPTRTTASS